MEALQTPELTLPQELTAQPIRWLQNPRLTLDTVASPDKAGPVLWHASVLQASQRGRGWEDSSGCTVLASKV